MNPTLSEANEIHKLIPSFRINILILHSCYCSLKQHSIQR